MRSSIILLIIVIVVIISISLVTFFCKMKINKYKYKYNLQEHFNNFVKKKLNEDSFVIKNNLNNIPMYYINLDKSTDRKNFMESQKKKFNLNLNRVKAVNGSSLLNKREGNIHSDKLGNISFVNKIFNGSYLESELGCTLSHLKAIKEIYHAGHDIAIILEDDVDFSPVALWTNDIQYYLNKAPIDWEIINFFSPNCIKNNNLKEYFIPFSKYCYGTVIYIINRIGMEKLMDNSNDIILNEKNYIVSDEYIYHKTQTYVMTKKLFLTKEHQSTINHTHDFKKYNQNLMQNLIKNWVSEFFNTYYINLEKRKDRRKEIEDELDKSLLNYKRFNAINIPNFGELGCSLSHLECLKLARKYQFPHILIFEDDFTFKKDPNTILKKLTTSMIDLEKNDGWDVIMLAGNINKSESTKFPNIRKILDAQTCSGYIVNKNFYDTLIKNIEEGIEQLKRYGRGKGYEIDQFWKKLQKKSRWYCLNPLGGYQRKSYSDIEKKSVNYKT